MYLPCKAYIPAKLAPDINPNTFAILGDILGGLFVIAGSAYLPAAYPSPYPAPPAKMLSAALRILDFLSGCANFVKCVENVWYRI